MIHKVSNKLSDIQSLIQVLKNNYPTNAFISYIEGEYGMRVAIYNSHVRNFINDVKDINLDTVIIGICFINHTIFLQDICDHIIEIQDTKFENSKLVESSHLHNPNLLNNSYCSSNDGWSNYYIRGIHCYEYEIMLNNINFSNIFFTSRCDGSIFINHEGNKQNQYSWDEQNSKIVGKINNKYYQNSSQLLLKFIPSVVKSNDISLHIRNTNKWSFRNLPENIYNSLFNYCIENKRTIHVFLDLTPVYIPENEYIKIYNNRVNNIPNIDLYTQIVNNCSIYIGCDSGFTEAISYYTSVPNIFIFENINKLVNTNNKNVNIFKSSQEIINLINNE